MWTFICWWDQRSRIKVKGYRRSYKKGWKCEIAKYEKLKSNWKQTWFMDTIWDPLYVYGVRGHLLRSKAIRGQVVRWTQDIKFPSFEKIIEFQFEPNFVYWQNTTTYTCSWGQSAQIKVKDHMRSTCKMLNIRFHSFFHTWGPLTTKCGITIINSHHPQTATTDDTSWFFCCLFLSFFCFCFCFFFLCLFVCLFLCWNHQICSNLTYLSLYWEKNWEGGQGIFFLMSHAPKWSCHQEWRTFP